MRKFVSISSRISWAADAICVESLFALIEAQQRTVEDQPDFLRQLIREARLGVLAALDDLSIDDFQMFSAFVAGILGDWLANPHEKARFIYDVSVLVSMLSCDPRSEDSTHGPILHRITSDSYYGIPLWVSRFIWTNIIVMFREKDLNDFADTISQQLDHIEAGFDLCDLSRTMLVAIKGALRNLKWLQLQRGGFSTSLRQRECDVYIDELIALIVGLTLQRVSP